MLIFLIVNFFFFRQMFVDLFSIKFTFHEIKTVNGNNVVFGGKLKKKKITCNIIILK